MKALFHSGTQKLISESKLIDPPVPRAFTTYVDDVVSISAGYGPDVQNMIVSVALAFRKHLIVKRKFVLSPKSAVVSSDLKLAQRVAVELVWGVCSGV